MKNRCLLFYCGFFWLLLGISPKLIGQSCYHLLRGKGLEMFNSGNFEGAIQEFQRAKDCADKPANPDLDSWIVKARAKITARQEEARRRKKTTPTNNQPVKTEPVPAIKTPAQLEADRLERERLADNAAWEIADSSGTAAAFEFYLKKYPNGQYTAKALQKLRQDTDTDGTPDLKDTCPTEAGSPTNNGCPVHAPADPPVTIYERDTILVPVAPEQCTYCPELVLIPADSFKMGSVNGDADEKPAHLVRLKGYYIGKHEVTNGQYCVFLNEANGTASTVKSWIDMNGSYENVKCRIQRSKQSFEVVSGFENYPVNFVTAKGALAYCKWLSEKTGHSYRLPSEPEWELAARDGFKAPGYEYSGSAEIEEVAWYYNNAEYKFHPVGLKKANAFGTFDMSGNVWEWVGGCYGKGYSIAPNPNPPSLAGQERLIADCKNLVCRGGSAFKFKKECKVTNREHNDPRKPVFDVGFRVARD